MTDALLTNSFDFSIRLIELARYLKKEGKEFPLLACLLECGNGIGVNLRLVAISGAKERTVQLGQALAFVTESEYILELMTKTRYLSEQQSIPLRAGCTHLKEGITDMKQGNRQSNAR
jgi:four helix bundle protein